MPVPAFSATPAPVELFLLLETTGDFGDQRSGERNVEDGSTAAEKRRRQRKTNLDDGDEWSVTYVPLAATKHESTKSSRNITILRSLYTSIQV